jgi:glutamyl endopeptidase
VTTTVHGGPLSRVDLESEVLGRDTRRRVRDTTTAPFLYICQLSHPAPGGGTRVGTGTLVGPRTVLTAAHVLAGGDPGRLRVTPALNGTVAPFGSALARSFRFWHPGFSAAADTSTVRDLALVELATPLTRASVWTGRATSTAADPIGRSISGAALPVKAGVGRVNLCGYPGDKCGTPAAPLPCGTTQWRTYDATVRVANGLLHYLNDTRGGHSGSPVWVRRHRSMGGRVLVAVHVDRYPPAGKATSNISVRLTPEMVTWIADHTR